MNLINSPKAKAIVAAIISTALSVLGLVGQLISAGEWNAQTTVALVTGIVLIVGTTLGVHQQPNSGG